MSRLLSRRCLTGRLASRAVPRPQRIRARLRPISADLSVSFRVKYHVHYGERLAILGSSSAIGKWDTHKAVPLKWTENDVWVIDCEFEPKEEVEYKYVRIDGEGEVIEWCPGNNRVLNFDASSSEDGHIVMTDTWEYTKQKPAPEIKAHPISADEGREKRRTRPTPPRIEDEEPFYQPSVSGSKVIDIGGPLDAPPIPYTQEQNSILSAIINSTTPLPAFPDLFAFPAK